MKRCVHCGSELADTAVRCGRCRKPAGLPPPAGERRAPFRFFPRFNARFREEVSTARGIAPALSFIAFAFAIARILESSGIGIAIVAALKRRYFVFSQEPVLTWQVYVFLQTFGLKLGLSLLLAAYLAVLRLPVRPALGLDKPGKLTPKIYGVFFLFSAAVGITSGLDPLTPAFPMHSFFGEALVWGNLIAVFSMIVVAPVAEEIFFRGFLYPAFNRAAGAAGAVVLTSLLFAAAHWRKDVDASTLGVIFLGSIGLTLARAWTGSTRASIRLHALYNTTILAAGFLRYALLGY